FRVLGLERCLALAQTTRDRPQGLVLDLAGQRPKRVRRRPRLPPDLFDLIFEGGCFLLSFLYFHDTTLPVSRCASKASRKPQSAQRPQRNLWFRPQIPQMIADGAAKRNRFAFEARTISRPEGRGRLGND